MFLAQQKLDITTKRPDHSPNMSQHVPTWAHFVPISGIARQLRTTPSECASGYPSELSMAGQVLQFIMNCLVLTISVSGYQVFKTKTLHGFVYLALVPKAYKVWASVCACPRTWSQEPKTMAMSGLKLADLQLSVDSSLAYFETRKHFCALNWMDKFRCTQHVPPQPANLSMCIPMKEWC